MHCSEAKGTLLAAWRSMPMCICREMQTPAQGAAEELYSRTVTPRCWWPSVSLTTGITTPFAPVPAYEQLLWLCSAWGKAELMHTCLQRLIPTATHPNHPPLQSTKCPFSSSQLVYPWGTSTPEIVVHLKCKFLAASSPERQSLCGGDMPTVPSVRPTEQVCKSSSIFTPAQVHFPTPMSSLCLWEVFQLQGTSLACICLCSFPASALPEWTQTWLSFSFETEEIWFSSQFHFGVLWQNTDLSFTLFRRRDASSSCGFNYISTAREP